MFCRLCVKRFIILEKVLFFSLEIISGSQTSLNFNPDFHTVHTMHAYSQLYQHCFDDERYTELQIMEADNYPNRGYLTPTV
jgi:hypothetical protein